MKLEIALVYPIPNTQIPNIFYQMPRKCVYDFSGLRYTTNLSCRFSIWQYSESDCGASLVEQLYYLQQQPNSLMYTKGNEVNLYVL